MTDVKQDVDAARQRWPRWPILALGLVSGVAIAPLVIATPFMRLIGDDYTFAERSMTLGIVGAASFWYEVSFGGFVYGLVAAFFGGFVGWGPFDWGYAPHVLFVLVMVAVVGSAYVGALSPRLRWFDGLLVGFTTIPLWVLGIGNLGPERDATVLIGYLNDIGKGPRPLTAWIYLLAVPAVWAARDQRMAVRSGIGLLFGCVGGLAILNLSPDVVAYAAIWTGLGLLASSRRVDWVSKRLAPGFWSLAGGTGVALAILLASPGTHARSELMPWYGMETFASVFGDQVLVYVRELTNVSMFLVAIAAAGLVVILRARGLCGHLDITRSLALRILALAGLALFVLLLSGALGSALSYGAVWHRWGVQQVEYAIFLVGGFLTGELLADRMRATKWQLAAVLSVAAIQLSALVPGVVALHLLQARQVVWDSGAPALLGFMEDRNADWVQADWLAIDELRRSKR